MENDNPEECKVCITNYDKGKRRPRTLPCGHTFCSLCLAGMIKLQRLTCPTCRVEHKATSTTHFPISYDMEAVIRKLKVLQLTVSPSSKPERRSLIQEKEDSISQLLSGFQETLSQLERYEVQLRDWKNQHEELLVKLSDLVERNQGALKLLEDELSILLYQRKKGEEGVSRLETTQGSLAGVHTAAEAATALDDSDRYNAEVEDWIQNCQKIFPDVNTIHTSLKVREATQRALETIKDADAGDDVAAVLLGDANYNIMDKVDQLAPILTMETLRQLGEAVKALINADKVVAVQQDHGRQLSSRITLHRGRLHLHTLLHQPTPVHAHTLEHETLMNLLDPASTLVFLDIGWAGSARGRIYIRLSPDTGLAKQFLLMCTGLRGPTYANTRILGVWNKGTEFEMVGGGDYDCNNGQGGTPLLQGLANCEEYRRPARAGVVRALHGPESSKSAQFSITTRDCPNREWYWAFGQVESGLDVLKAVANHKCIKEVTVVDCGVLLPP